MAPDTYKSIDKTIHAEFVRFLSKIQGFVKLLELLCSLDQQFFLFCNFLFIFSFKIIVSRNVY